MENKFQYDNSTEISCNVPVYIGNGNDMRFKVNNETALSQKTVSVCGLKVSKWKITEQIFYEILRNCVF